MSYQPLAGVKVLDLGILIPAALTSGKLAALGAEVVKVEQPPHGDRLRAIPPFGDDGESPQHMGQSWGKRSIGLDVRRPGDREVILALARRADVIVENQLAGFWAGKGIDFAALRRERPALVVCSVTGFGQTGPWATLPAHGLNMDALADTLPVEWEDGQPRRASPAGATSSAPPSRRWPWSPHCSAPRRPARAPGSTCPAGTRSSRATGRKLAMTKEGGASRCSGRCGSVYDLASEVTELGGRALAHDLRRAVPRAGRRRRDHGGRVPARIDSLVTTSVKFAADLETDDRPATPRSAGGSGRGDVYGMQAALPTCERAAGSIVRFGPGTAIGETDVRRLRQAKEDHPRASGRPARVGPERHPRNVVGRPRWHRRRRVHAAPGMPGLTPPPAFDGNREEIGRAVAALVSDDLGYLTGATLSSAAGWTILGRGATVRSG